MKIRWFVVVALVIVTGLLLSACSQAAPQVQIVKETVIVEATKIVEKVVEATTIVEITSTPAPDRADHLVHWPWARVRSLRKSHWRRTSSRSSTSPRTKFSSSRSSWTTSTRATT
ncbi:MAG: hypothetical protein IPO15_19960 [Anaerolineae bacterium]|uniref:hypothetical protein n=1 Tax=Candidatus Amarolinea dominans TaxID=3140696 RepID=UPI00313526C7|nr:hypothetical protein [Anaerolineae bacterium]